ncbi:MAG: hypothetical protein H6Q59_1278 [Firmicutes bacterium]|nr:hypothetical protein [Bacillota bacterium]
MDHSSMHHTTEPNVMLLNGNGQVSAVPDVAVLRLGVQTEGENLQEIQANNAELSQAVIQAMRQLGIEDIKTFQYDINKVFEFTDGKQTDKGYSVRNVLEFRIKDLSLVGTAIDTAVYYGANIVEAIQFAVSDTSRYYLQALNLALADAFEKANSIADSIGLSLQPYPRRITENSTPAVPFRTVNMREGALASTPIEAGTNRIEASVTVEFIY